jgi:hypothetical protein
MSDEKKSYYAIIPANVRYDKNLCPNARLLYGEITALCNEKGYCWAKNEYFAELYDVHKNTISKWINQLKLYQYINVKIDFESYQREIWLNELIDPQRNAEGGINEKMNTPQRNAEKNITYNNTINNTKKFIKPTPEEIQSYLNDLNCKLFSGKYFFDKNESIGWVVGKNKSPMKSWQATIRTWIHNNKQNNDSYPYKKYKEGKVVNE